MSTFAPSGAVSCIACTRAALFQARVEWQAGRGNVRRRANACTAHVVEAIQLLRAWGHAGELAGGWLTVSAIEPRLLPRLAAAGITGPDFICYSAPLALVPGQIEC